jgi:adenylate cyclase
MEVLAGQLAVTIALHETGGFDPAVPPRRPHVRRRSDETAVSFFEHDGTILVEGNYVIKGVAGRILFALLAEHLRSGRTDFTNRELRLDRSIGLPAGKDNLEARLLALRRRLAERDDPFTVERVGRGLLRLTVRGPLSLQHHTGGDSYPR